MALIRLPCVMNRRCKDNFNLLRYLFLRYTSKSSSRQTPRTDALDIYTDNLLQEVSNKWNMVIVNLLSRSKQSLNNNCQNIGSSSKLSIDELQSKIVDSISNSDINEVQHLVKICKKNSYCLHSDFVINVIKLFAKLGNKEGVEDLQSLFKIANEKEYIKKCSLKFYTAQVLWYSGNYNEAFEMLENLYLNDSIKHDVNFVIYDIISSAVMKNEASLVLVTHFVQELVDRHNNYYPISILWKKLTESEFFADHQLAEKLLQNNRELIMVIRPLIPLWCVNLLQYHKIDAIHKMCEVLLQNDCLEHYSSVLHSLFDYYYKQHNLKMCSAVMKSSLDLQIPLKQSYQNKFLTLLLSGKPDTGKQKLVDSIPEVIQHQINLKF